MSDLPTEILSIICSKLVDISDYARFGAVCKPWRDIVWQIRGKIPPQLPVPVLLFPANSSDNSSSCMHTHSFYSLSFSKKLIINGNNRRFRRIYGSSHGWLIIEDYSNMIQLLNPFLSDNNVIKLPSLEPERNYFSIKAAILSHNPSWTSDYVVMLLLINGMITSVAFLKPGHTNWTHVSVDQEFEGLRDSIIYYEDRFYAISRLGEVVVFCDINSTQPSLQRVAPSPIPNIGENVYIAGERCQAYTQAFLVESSGDLLCVVCSIKSKTNMYRHLSWTDGFQIFKLQTKQGWRWIELNTLGGHALFLDKGFSTSLLASDFQHCKANHIYFTHLGIGFYMGVFNLADKSIQIPYSKTLNSREYPLLVQPTLNMMSVFGSRNSDSGKISSINGNIMIRERSCARKREKKRLRWKEF